MLNSIKKVKGFFSETIEELKKSTWPKGKELRKSTIIVVIGMFFLSFYVSVIDFSLLNVVDFVSKHVRR